ncbi:hypothetical protein [Streptomyces sp. NPDC059165]|uniref:hypothetical protein n=1 Tax=Streptomyces sp. NPDC059165 TaxID=3346751 RepID=UPI0036B47AFB
MGTHLRGADGAFGADTVAVAAQLRDRALGVPYVVAGKGALVTLAAERGARGRVEQEVPVGCGQGTETPEGRRTERRVPGRRALARPVRGRHRGGSTVWRGLRPARGPAFPTGRRDEEVGRPAPGRGVLRGTGEPRCSWRLRRQLLVVWAVV